MMLGFGSNNPCIMLFPFYRIGKRFICGADNQEYFSGVFIARISIRMEFLAQSLVCSAYYFGRSIARYFEIIVVRMNFRHKNERPLDHKSVLRIASLVIPYCKCYEVGLSQHLFEANIRRAGVVFRKCPAFAAVLDDRSQLMFIETKARMPSHYRFVKPGQGNTDAGK